MRRDGRARTREHLTSPTDFLEEAGPAPSRLAADRPISVAAALRRRERGRPFPSRAANIEKRSRRPIGTGRTPFVLSRCPKVDSRKKRPLPSRSPAEERISDGAFSESARASEPGDDGGRRAEGRGEVAAAVSYRGGGGGGGGRASRAEGEERFASRRV
ncbi:hypothetical protein KM043_000044, partial [Ampulex compressa]